MDMNRPEHDNGVALRHAHAILGNGYGLIKKEPDTQSEAKICSPFLIFHRLRVFKRGGYRFA